MNFVSLFRWWSIDPSTVKNPVKRTPALILKIFQNDPVHQLIPLMSKHPELEIRITEQESLLGKLASYLK